MSDLFWAFERLGASPGERRDGGLEVHGNGERIEFAIKERLRHYKFPPTDFDKKYRTTVFQRGYGQGLEPTGLLALEIETYAPGVRTKWQEAEAKPQLGEQVDAIASEIVAGLRYAAAKREIKRVEDERAAAQAAELAEKHRLLLVEERQWETLVELATNWDSHKRVRRFIGALRRSETTDLTEQVHGRSIGEWIRWAEERLAKNEPTAGGASGAFATLSSISDPDE